MASDAQGIPCIGGRYKPVTGGEWGGIIITNGLLPESWDTTPYVAHALDAASVASMREAVEETIYDQVRPLNVDENALADAVLKALGLGGDS